jgi:hypothetical protein
MRSVARRSREAEPPRHPVITEPKSIALGSPVEDLGLSVRTRNALRGIGCDTVEDLLGLEFSSPVRGVGRKTREELLTALERTGFRHPTAESEPASEEMRLLESSLERMQGRLEAALGAVAREIRLIKQRLRKLANKRAD